MGTVQTRLKGLGEVGAADMPRVSTLDLKEIWDLGSDPEDLCGIAALTAERDGLLPSYIETAQKGLSNLLLGLQEAPLALLASRDNL